MRDKLVEVFEMDLDRLAKEIELYPSEDSMWIAAPGITNSGGNLALHIMGNLQHFVGHILGGTDYLRDRPAEFASKAISKETLQKTLITTRKDVAKSIGALSVEDLDKPYPMEVAFGPEKMTVFQSLVILAGHLNYHLGQINYHRRLLA